MNPYPICESVWGSCAIHLGNRCEVGVTLWKPQLNGGVVREPVFPISFHPLLSFFFFRAYFKTEALDGAVSTQPSAASELV